MNTPFKINRVIAEIDYEKIDEKYDFFEIAETREDKYFEFSASLLDDLIMEKAICAVQFHGGKKVYVMMKKDDKNLDRVNTVKNKSKDAEYLSCCSTPVASIDEYRLIQLFLNGLFRSEHPKLSYNNIGGHLYCFHPSWLKRSKEVLWKIPTLDVKINRQKSLSLSVCTFSELKLVLKHSKSKEEKAKVLSKPKYVCIGNNTMRRTLEGDDLLEYIAGSTGSTKTNIPFIKLWPAVAFLESKMGMLSNITEKFNKDYDGLVHIDFAEISDYKSFDFSKDVEKENKKAIETALSNVSVKILDEIGSEEYESKKCCEDIQSAIENKYHLKASIGKRPEKDALNISLIHEPEYYESTGEPDPHQKECDGITIQHITLQNGMKHLEESISTIIQNALIKKDILVKKISLFDWAKTGLTEKISFGIAEKIPDTKSLYKYYVMDINPDGTFDIHELENTVFNNEEYQKWADIFEKTRMEKRPKEEPAEGIIRNALGKIIVIRSSDKITLPNFEKIKIDIDSGATNIKRAETFEEFYSGCMNIKMFEDCGKTYYCVGRKDKNPTYTIPRAVNIREIQTYDGESSIQDFEKLLPLMSVEFVRNGQLTVVPFPFKYLREWIDMNKEKLNSNRN